jgi:hypothetical protein
MSYTMTPALMNRAVQLAADARKNTERHLEKIAEAEKRKAEIESEIRKSRAAAARLSEFDPYDGYDYQCPRCWIVDGVRAKIKPITRDEARIDYFQCERCGEETSGKA